MTILPFLLVSLGVGAASLVTRRSPLLSTTIGLLGLLAACLAAAAIDPAERLLIGGAEVAGSAYLRLFALLGSLVALLLTVIGLATVSHRHLPGTLLAGTGAAAFALALPDARIAILAATVGSLIGILVTLATPPSARSVLVGIRELRAIGIAGALALLAAAWIGRPLEQLATEPAVFGLAYLGFALAVAIRFGAIPFHYWAARLADAVPEVALPLVMAWLPAAVAVVALSWVDQSVAPLLPLVPLTIERALVIAVGAVSVILGSIAAWIHDDLEHVVGYLIVADAGIAILALAALAPEAWQPARTWLLVFVMTRSAFAGWAAAMRGQFGTRRVDELRGWLPRAPLLAVALGVIAAASIGWPGLAGWDARSTLIGITLAGPFALLVTAGALAPLAVYGRLVLIGLGPPSQAVARGASGLPRRPDVTDTGPRPVPIDHEAHPEPASVSSSRSGNRAGAGGRDRGSAPAGLVAGQGLPSGIGSRLGSGLDDARLRARQAVGGLGGLGLGPAAISANRTPIVAVVVLALAGLAFLVSAGGLGIGQAASAVPFQPGEPTESGIPVGSQTPQESEPPLPSESVGIPPEPSASASASIPAASPGASLGASPSFAPVP